ncbi:MAG: hypothetical protein ACYTDU_05810 [Planctomycetota bacterium]|jgi:hypothetical protein
MRWLTLCLLASAAWAQGVPFDRTAISMLPGIEDPVRRKLHQIHGATMNDVRKVHKHLQRIEAQLKKKPDRAKAKALRAEQARLGERVPELYRQLELRAREAGLSEEQVERLERMPRGVLREERYNHGVLLDVEGLTGDQRALLESLVTSTDAAQSAITAQKQHLVRGVDKANKTLRRHLTSTCDQQCREIERRFWRAAYYTLTPDQMRAARRLFSPRYAYVPDHRRQLYLLPGMAPSQANRIRALFAELDSEAAADNAAMNQIRTQLKDKKLPKEKRAELYRRSAEAGRRAGRIAQRTRAAVWEILTPAQQAAYRALPPRLSIGDRTRAPWEVVRAMRLRPEQLVRVRALQNEANRARKATQQAIQADVADLKQAGLGPESPQMMMMEMAQQDTRGRLTEQRRRAGHLLFLEVLDPGQVAAWIVAPTVTR